MQFLEQFKSPEEIPQMIQRLAEASKRFPASAFDALKARASFTHLTVFVFKPKPQYYASILDGRMTIEASCYLFDDAQGRLCLQMRIDGRERIEDRKIEWAAHLQPPISKAEDDAYLSGDTYGYPMEWHQQVCRLIALEIEEDRNAAERPSEAHVEYVYTHPDKWERKSDE